MTPPYQVPSSIKSTYRIFLRACATAVLHHPAKRQLRRLWRANFEEAVAVHNEYASSNLTPAQRAKHELWLQVWEERVDNTLEMLLTSSTSRGLPHLLTKNLAVLDRDFHEFISQTYIRPGPVWNPAPERYIDVKELRRNQEKRRVGMLRGRDLEYDMQAWGALEEAIRMAEGTAGLVLGRPTFRRVRGASS